ncbi:hypothetical protein E1301_Tti014069 [Triplophysa tibetana]|uniref:Uncharacterized protein n=1 Tax=Triplophysa tibetana TaxID=1572043 RepID=A0A5A9NBK7_9TELE|nr:hypothetical protein E1301_Tti014069 [Triplophysa tibetana]
MTLNATGRADNVKLYSTAASVGLQSTPDRPINTDLWRLKKDLWNLLARHPDGIPLSKVRRSCPFILNPQVLKGHTSVRHLLQSIPDVVRLSGFGVQTMVLPTNTQ